jgi:hypothetical protein
MDDPIVHVTIYSESDSFVVFDVFVVEQHGYDVQLDTENLVYVWRAIANADIVTAAVMRITMSILILVPRCFRRQRMIVSSIYGSWVRTRYHVIGNWRFGPKR